MNKEKAIKLIDEIQNGSGVPNRDSYPKKWRGEWANFENGHFSLGMEYGYILALMHTFNLTQKEVEKKILK